MSNKMRIPLKIAVFCAVFYVLCVCVAFLFRNDQGSYARVLMHELYEQDNIDIMYCGSSHVSHGIVPEVADKMTGKNNFSTGTAAQSIQGTYAILQQAVKLHKIEKVFLEMEFAITTQAPKEKRTGFKADYLVAKYIKDPKIRFEFLTSISTPKYYLNHFLPIGKDKYMTLNPANLSYRFKSILSGDYFRYTYEDSDDEYAGKGCLLDVRTVKNGSFSETITESPIAISAISKDYQDTVDKIIGLCKAHDIELIFYSMPCTDFYLNEKGNYDDYYSFCKAFTAARGYDFYDFNLAKETYMDFEDEDFRDDNHFNRQGVYKWTRAFWNYFLGDISKEDMFYTSYAEKMASQPDRIFGLIYHFSDDKRCLEIQPVVNHVAQNRITYDVYAVTGSGETVLAEKSHETTVKLPSGMSGHIRVISYLDGVQQNDCTEKFASF